MYSDENISVDIVIVMKKYDAIPKKHDPLYKDIDTWNRCDICSKRMKSKHLLIRIYPGDNGEEYRDTSRWVCSEKCFTTWILQQL